RTTTVKYSPRGVTRADARPGATSATATAARRTSTGRKRTGRAIQLSILTEPAPQTEGSLASTLRELLEQLLEARRALERGQAGRLVEALPLPAPPHPPAPGSRDRRRGAHEAADEKVPRSPPSSLCVHGTIVPCASRRSVTYCST